MPLLRQEETSWSISTQLSRAVRLNFRALVQGAGHHPRFPALRWTLNRVSTGSDGCEIAPALPVEGQLAEQKAAVESPVPLPGREVDCDWAEEASPAPHFPPVSDQRW